MKFPKIASPNHGYWMFIKPWKPILRRLHRYTSSATQPIDVKMTRSQPGIATRTFGVSHFLDLPFRVAVREDQREKGKQAGNQRDKLLCTKKAGSVNPTKEATNGTNPKPESPKSCSLNPTKGSDSLAPAEGNPTKSAASFFACQLKLKKAIGLYSKQL